MLLQILSTKPIIIFLTIVGATLLSVSILIISIWYNKPRYKITPEELDGVTLYYIEEKVYFKYIITFSTTNKSTATERLEELVRRDDAKKEAKKSKLKPYP